MTDWLFVDGTLELSLFMLIILIASIIRGAIGFGFSALVVASSSFWLPPVAVVALVVLLEIAASALMLNSIRGDIDFKLLLPLSLGGLPGILVGVTLLTHIEPLFLQLLMGSYLIIIVLVSLLNLPFKPSPGTARLSGVGLIAGFFNGLAGMGGLFIATFLNGSRMAVKDIRATLVIYFFLSEVIFLIGAQMNNVYSREIIMTAAVALLPMAVGIQLGNQLFRQLPEQVLRRGVLIALLLISVLGLLKYV